MPTSANDRLGHLFANIPLPTKSDTNAVNSSTAECSQIGNEKAPFMATESTVSPNAQAWATPLDRDAFAASSDDDDYIAAFAEKPQMKAPKSKARFKPEPGASGYPKDVVIEPLKPIVCLPQGKRSSGHHERSDHEVEDQDPGSPAYSGNGNTLLGQFCLFSLVTKFPYKYMDDPNDRVSRHFFASNKIYDRAWDLHYLHPPQPFSKGPVLLVPLSQVQTLIDEISKIFKIDMKVPDYPFTFSFWDDGTPQPVFLGSSNSREEVKELTDNIPSAQPDHGECPKNAAADVVYRYEKFHRKCEQALLTSKGKSKGSAKKGSSKNSSHTVQETQNQMMRAERYLGLRPRTKPVDRPAGLSWNEAKESEAAQLRPCGLLVDFVDVERPAQYSFDCEPVIISIDIEWYERDHNLITEVGISTLDTLDLEGLPPGPRGENWTKHIRSRHFRIKGRESLVNKDFCPGNPDAFQFGKSEIVALDEISEAVDACFEWPYSVQFKRVGPFLPSCEAEMIENSPEVDLGALQKGPKQRNLVLLGHDVGTDLLYLKKIGSEVFNPPSSYPQASDNPPRRNRHRILTSILETLDTALLFRSFKKEKQPRSLAYICNELGIDAWQTHNGGNDARYTMESFIKLVLKARLARDEKQRQTDPWRGALVEDEMEAARIRRIDEKMDEARQKIREKRDALERGDGVAPEASRSAVPELKPEERWRHWEEFNGATVDNTAWPDVPQKSSTKW